MRLQAHRIDQQIRSQWISVDFVPRFNDRPVTITSVQTAREQDPVSPRLDDVDAAGYRIAIDDVGDYADEVAHLATDAGFIRDTEGRIVGEAGMKMMDQPSPTAWETFDLEGSYSDPVVFAQVMSHNGGQPCHTRVDQVGATSFDVKIEEWESQDQSHTQERIGYVVLEAKADAYILDNGMLVEVGTREIDEDWKSIKVSSRWGQDPKVISHCQTARGGDAVVTRQKAPPYWVTQYPKDPPEFALRLEEEGRYEGHKMEEVGYLVVDKALQTEAGMTAESRTEKWEAIDLSSAFRNPPVVLTSMQTFNGSDAAAVRLDDWSKDGVTARIEEPYGSNTPPVHSNAEAIGYFAVENETVLVDTDGNDIGIAGSGSLRLPKQGTMSLVVDTGWMDTPVGFAQVLTYNGPQSCHTRLSWKNNRSKMQVVLEEWYGYDKVHDYERIGYVILEGGTKHQLDNGMLIYVDEVVTDHTFTSASFPAELNPFPVGEDPTIISRCQTTRGGDAVVTRQRRKLGADRNSFEVRLQEGEVDGPLGLVEKGPEHTQERIGYLVASQPLRIDAGRTDPVMDHTFGPVTFGGSFSEDPVVLTDMQTFNGPDPAGVRIANLSARGFEAMIEEDNSTGSGTEHTNKERLGYFAINNGPIRDTKGNVIGEADTFQFGMGSENDFATPGLHLSLDYNELAVFGQIMTYNGKDPCHIRPISWLGAPTSALYAKIEEWNYTHGWHKPEKVGYVAIMDGIHQLDDGTSIEVGHWWVDDQWERVPINLDLASDPTVITQPAEVREDTPVVTRHRNITKNDFEVRLQEEEAEDGDHAEEKIAYLVIG